MSVDDAFRLLLTQVVHDECLPFSMHIPNAETIEAMKAADRGKDNTLRPPKSSSKNSAYK